MDIPEEPFGERIWRCLHCRGRLAPDTVGLYCTGCAKQYPVISGIPILVREPAVYLRSELAALTQVSRDAKQRRDLLDRTGRDAGLPKISLDRHRDVMDTEIAQVETLLGLLESVAKTLEVLPGSAGESVSARRPGWTFDRLLLYLLRDWTNTSELEAAHSAIGAILKQAIPDPSGKTVVFPGCGAGGLLAKISPSFGRVLGFDLSLPVLVAARHLLDGSSLDLAMPGSIAKRDRIALRKRNSPSAGTHVELLAMDAFDTAFADGSIDCVITSFLMDIIPDPRRVAAEIHRILPHNGVWINYGPSGRSKAPWLFDHVEGAAFFESSGFTIIGTEEYRATNLDLSRDLPGWSFESHMCYLTAARKTRPGRERTRMAAPPPSELPRIVPLHFPRANLVQRETLGAKPTYNILFHHERIAGHRESFEIGSDTAEIIALVDGKRTVHEIAGLLKQALPTFTAEETVDAFSRFFNQGLLSWHEEGQ